VKRHPQIFNLQSSISARPGQEVSKVNYETIEYQELEKGIGIIALNRPRRYNSVSYKMMEELEHFWVQKQHDLATHVLIMKGNGDKGFCAGLDMRESMEKYF